MKNLKDLESGSNFVSRFISDYETRSCLGRGAYGVVFQAKNKVDGIEYAVKRITLPSAEADKTKVLREVTQHARLNHNNIVRYFTTWIESPPVGEKKQFTLLFHRWRNCGN